MENTSVNQPQKKKSKTRKILVRTGFTLLVLVLLGIIAFQVSPWPSALLIRYAFEKGGKKANDSLAKHVPPRIASLPAQQYDEKDGDAFLDVYFPDSIARTDKQLPVIVWIHGGGWVSGHKEDLANYCKILAGKGYTTVALDYTVAPEKKYPTPLKQVNAALAWLKQNAAKFHIDPSHFILAGDSGGAHIAAQAGAIVTSAEYASLLGVTPGITASELSGLMLYCGPYDAEHINLPGGFGWFVKSILWSYLGKKDYTTTPLYKSFSVINYIGNHFPPSFISVGNADPLHVQSEALARKLTSLGVTVDTLFFPADYKPSLPHEYQFNMDIDAGEKALDKSVLFLQNLMGAANEL